jgi:hypothetical protein
MRFPLRAEDKVKGHLNEHAGGHDISNLPITVHHVEAVLWCTTYTGEEPFPVRLTQVEVCVHQWGFQ